ncbi:MAG: type II toxin-antitoxin system VapC family toxin [Promethearchaeota archaeon]|nr:MAG: type II toxin-antitoxin system VapC family toxin [Candidatus Lokiarchaeota archaeon]
MKVSLDTNVFIAIKNKEENFTYCENILDAIEENQFKCIISTIVLSEVLVGFYQNNELEEADRFLSKALLNYILMPVDTSISQKAAQIRAQYQIKLPDAIIAASTILSDSEVFITYNKPLLKKLKIQVLSPVEFVEKYMRSELD